MALTPEEQQELNELEELAELEELEQLEQMESQSQQVEKPQFDDSPLGAAAENLGLRTEVFEDQEAEDRAKAVGLGVVEGVPFAKDVAAGVEAIVDPEERSFGEAYTRNKKEWDQAINEAEEKNPVAFTAGDIVGGVSSLALPGSATIKGAAAFGALSGLSRSEDREVTDIIAGAALGTIGGTIGKGLQKGAQTMRKALGNLSRGGALEQAGALTPGKTREINKTIQKIFNPMGNKSRVETTNEFVETMYKETLDGDPLFRAFDSPAEIFEKAGRKKNIYGKEIGKLLKEADEVAGEIDTESLYNKILKESDLLKRQMSDDPVTANLAAKAKADLDTVFKEAVGFEQQTNTPIMGFKRMGVKRLHDLKSDIADTVSKSFKKELGDLSVDTAVKKQQVGIISDEIENLVENSGVDTKIAKSFGDLNKKWRTLNMIEDLNMDIAFSDSGGPLKKVRQLIGARGLIAGSLFAAGGAAKETALMLGTGLNVLANDPRTASVLAVGARKFNNFIQANPSSELVRRVTTASAISSESFRVALHSAVSEVGFMESPLPRDPKAVKERSDDVLQVFQYHQPQIAGSLRQAIDQDDDEGINQIMEQVSKDPKTKGLIEEGVGWGGKVYDPVMKAQLEEDIKTKDMSLKQKLELKKNLIENNIIPVPEPEPDRTFQFVPRNKDAPRY